MNSPSTLVYVLRRIGLGRSPGVPVNTSSVVVVPAWPPTNTFYTKERRKENGEERKKVDLTVEFPFRPEIVHRPPDRRPVPVLRRLLPRSARELPLRLEVVLRLLHHSPLAPRRRVIRSSLPNEISLHSKVILVVVDRLPVHQTFLVEFLAVRCDRVHRLAPWDLQVILGQEIVGATVPPAKFQNSSVVFLTDFRKREER